MAARLPASRRPSTIFRPPALALLDSRAPRRDAQLPVGVRALSTSSPVLFGTGSPPDARLASQKLVEEAKALAHELGRDDDEPGRGKRLLRRVRALGWYTGRWVVVHAWRYSKAFGLTLWAFIRQPSIAKQWYADIKHATIHFVEWVKKGTLLFKKNLQISNQLVAKTLNGNKLTFRERKLLIRTTGDCFKIVPFSLFLIIPLAEFALPIFLRLFPNMLPSTFFDRPDKGALEKKLEAKVALSAFFRDMVHERTTEIQEKGTSKHLDLANEFADFQAKLLSAPPGTLFPSAAELVKFAPLFRAEFTVDSLSVDQLTVISQMLGRTEFPVRIQSHLALTLRHHLLRIRNEDKEISWEGLDHFTTRELEDMCKERGMRFVNVEGIEEGDWKVQLKLQMESWIDLSQRQECPIVLLLWTRALLMGRDNLTLVVEREPTNSAEDAKEIFHRIDERIEEKIHEQEERLEVTKKELENIEHEREEEKAIEQGIAMPIGSLATPGPDFSVDATPGAEKEDDFPKKSLPPKELLLAQTEHLRKLLYNGKVTVNNHAAEVRRILPQFVQLQVQLEGHRAPKEILDEIREIHGELAQLVATLEKKHAALMESDNPDAAMGDAGAPAAEPDAAGRPAGFADDDPPGYPAVQRMNQ